MDKSIKIFVLWLLVLSLKFKKKNKEKKRAFWQEMSQQKRKARRARCTVVHPDFYMASFTFESYLKEKRRKTRTAQNIRFQSLPETSPALKTQNPRWRHIKLRNRC